MTTFATAARAAVITAAAVTLTLTGCGTVTDLTGRAGGAPSGPVPVTAADTPVPAVPVTAAPARSAQPDGPSSAASAPEPAAPSWTDPVDRPDGDPRAVVDAAVDRLRDSGALTGDPDTATLRVTTLIDASGRPGVEVRTVTGRAAAEAVVNAQQRRRDAVAVSVDGRKRTLQAAPVGDTHTAAAAKPSNDTYRSLQWPLTKLNAEQVWRTASGSGVVVAVVDTGVDGAHPDLTGRVLPGKDYVTTSGDGRVDPHGHGTHVAGTVAAVAGNRIGVAGLAPTAHVLPVRVLGPSGAGWDSDIAAGIVWAADHGADVINLSLGGDRDPLTEAAVAYARSQGVLVVAAAGNDRTHGSPTTYPAAFPGVVAVAATTADDVSADFSNVGSYIDVAAPGDTVASTWPGGSYMYSSGTSMAAPHAAALAALVIDASGHRVRGDQAGTLIRSTATDLGRYGWDDDTGYGLINAAAAVCAAADTCPATPAPTPAPAPPSPTTPAPTTPAPTTPAPTTPAPTTTTAPPVPTTPAPSSPSVDPTPPATGPTTPAPTTPAPTTPAPTTPAPTSPSVTPTPSTPVPTTPSPTTPAPTTPKPTPTPPKPPTPTPPKPPAPKPPAKGPVAVKLTSAAAYVWSGDVATVTATLRRTDTGTPVAWSPAVLETIQNGRVVARSTVFTGGAGTLTVPRPIRHTTTFRIKFTGTDQLAAASSGTVTYTAMPKTTIKYARNTVSVGVHPAAGQRVSVQRLVSGRWTTVTAKNVSRTGTAQFIGVPTGTLRVYIAAAPGLDDVTSAPWKTK